MVFSHSPGDNGYPAVDRDLGPPRRLRARARRVPRPTRSERLGGRGRRRASRRSLLFGRPRRHSLRGGAHRRQRVVSRRQGARRGTSRTLLPRDAGQRGLPAAHARLLRALWSAESRRREVRPGSFDFRGADGRAAARALSGIPRMGRLGLGAMGGDLRPRRAKRRDPRSAAMGGHGAPLGRPRCRRSRRCGGAPR